ncbi:PhzF family phenazine biosynthesis protein [Limoniibacter endophyticus]|uniref:Isomerase n=1 Tax=Limoniibacter endophyticus TaxID=1565040 RepID=A0A8J3GI84_9HYPH|nr:PhzF family phenazine biosynthesis protein [Limoniibacter endophyticus]GHC75439.1 isomerase [Limoniibacter endophyticus]
MTTRAFSTYDVFTEKPLSGNQLAIVWNAEGLDAPRMQAIAREFNLSETVFVLPPEDKRHTARLRIFTPFAELDFAGHPTVGAAIAIGERNRDAANDRTAIMALEENVGVVRCVVDLTDKCFAEFDLPRLPAPVASSIQPELAAAALGLDHSDIGFENHQPMLWTAGNPIALIPIHGLAAIARARIDLAIWADVLEDYPATTPSAYLYCRECIGSDCAFHARKFSPFPDGGEDPATGSAVAALAGAIQHFDRMPEGAHRLWVEQGMEINRPSRIRLEMDIVGGAIDTARIGGHAVKISEGKLLV